MAKEEKVEKKKKRKLRWQVKLFIIILIIIIYAFIIGPKGIFVKEYKITIDKETKMLLPKKNLDKLFTKK